MFSGMVSIPVSVYQTVVTSMAQLNGENTAAGNQQVQIAMAPLTTDDINPNVVAIKEIEESDEESDTEQMVVAFQSPQQQQQTQQQQQQLKGSVPDATQAVEVMTVEPELKPI